MYEKGNNDNEKEWPWNPFNVDAKYGKSNSITMLLRNILEIQHF